MNELPPNFLGPSVWYNNPFEKAKQINKHRPCFFSKTVRNYTFWRLEMETSTVGFSDMIYLRKGFPIRSLVFWRCFPFFQKMRQIFSNFWFWVGNNKLKEFHICRISIKSKYCRFSNYHENSIFSFVEYWAKSLFTSSIIFITNYLIRFSYDKIFFEPVPSI